MDENGNGLDHCAAALALLEHVQNVADRDQFHGDREAYMTRKLAQAQLHATLAVAAELRSVARATYSVAGP